MGTSMSKLSFKKRHLSLVVTWILLRKNYSFAADGMLLTEATLAIIPPIIVIVQADENENIQLTIECNSSR